MRGTSLVVQRVKKYISFAGCGYFPLIAETRGLNMIQLSVQGWECMPCLQRSPILSCYLATLPVSGAL